MIDAVSIEQLVILIVIAVVYLLPLFLLLFSRRVTGLTKFAWLVVIFFTNWLGYCVFHWRTKPRLT
ncbi:hypothetical protein [Marinomonas sp.]